MSAMVSCVMMVYGYVKASVLFPWSPRCVGTFRWGTGDEEVGLRCGDFLFVLRLHIQPRLCIT